MRDEGLPASEAAAIWLSERVHDPPLSDKGQQEASWAATALVECLGAERGRSALVVPSPMLRALQVRGN